MTYFPRTGHHDEEYGSGASCSNAGAKHYPPTGHEMNVLMSRPDPHGKLTETISTAHDDAVKGRLGDVKRTIHGLAALGHRTVHSRPPANVTGRSNHPLLSRLPISTSREHYQVPQGGGSYTRRSLGVFAGAAPLADKSPLLALPYGGALPEKKKQNAAPPPPIGPARVRPYRGQGLDLTGRGPTDYRTTYKDYGAHPRPPTAGAPAGPPKSGGTRDLSNEDEGVGQYPWRGEGYGHALYNPISMPGPGVAHKSRVSQRLEWEGYVHLAPQTVYQATHTNQYTQPEGHSLCGAGRSFPQAALTNSLNDHQSVANDPAVPCDKRGTGTEMYPDHARGLLLQQDSLQHSAAGFLIRGGQPDHSVPDDPQALVAATSYLVDHHVARPRSTATAALLTEADIETSRCEAPTEFSGTTTYNDAYNPRKDIAECP